MMHIRPIVVLKCKQCGAEKIRYNGTRIGRCRKCWTRKIEYTETIVAGGRIQCGQCGRWHIIRRENASALPPGVKNVICEDCIKNAEFYALDLKLDGVGLNVEERARWESLKSAR